MVHPLDDAFKGINGEGKGRDQVLDCMVSTIAAKIKDLKKNATTLDLNKISWLYHGMQELKLAKTLDQTGVAARIATLKEIEKYDKDPDDKMLASASLKALSIAAKHIRSNT